MRVQALSILLLVSLPWASFATDVITGQEERGSNSNELFNDAESSSVIDETTAALSAWASETYAWVLRGSNIMGLCTPFSVLVYFIGGALWYSPLMCGNSWVKETQFRPQDHQHNMVLTFGSAAVLSCFKCALMKCWLDVIAPISPVGAIISVLLLGSFVLFYTLNEFVDNLSSFKLALILAGGELWQISCFLIPYILDGVVDISMQVR